MHVIELPIPFLRDSELTQDIKILENQPPEKIRARQAGKEGKQSISGAPYLDYKMFLFW